MKERKETSAICLLQTQTQKTRTVPQGRPWQHGNNMKKQSKFHSLKSLNRILLLFLGNLGNLHKLRKLELIKIVTNLCCWWDLDGWFHISTVIASYGTKVMELFYFPPLAKVNSNFLFEGDDQDRKTRRVGLSMRHPSWRGSMDRTNIVSNNAKIEEEKFVTKTMARLI